MNLTLPQIKKDPLAVGIAHDNLVELVQRRGLGHGPKAKQNSQSCAQAEHATVVVDLLGEQGVFDRYVLSLQQQLFGAGVVGVAVVSTRPIDFAHEV